MGFFCVGVDVDGLIDGYCVDVVYLMVVVVLFDIDGVLVLLWCVIFGVVEIVW